MIQTHKTKDGKLSIIARIGVKYIPFELDNVAQDWVRQQPSEDAISPVDLVGMVLGGQAHVASRSSHSKYLRRIEEEDQIPLKLDFTESFLHCDETGQKENLLLCVIDHGQELDLKLLTPTAAAMLPVRHSVPIDELSIEQLKSIIEDGNFSQAHTTVKRLKHWFAGRMELWGLAYG
jgi:hypothetical protein